jgi:hypothetical protein
LQGRTHAIEPHRGIEGESKRQTYYNEEVDLSEVFGIAFSVIELVLAHFVVLDDSIWQESGVQNKAKCKSLLPSKELSIDVISRNENILRGPNGCFNRVLTGLST